ncbi:hypothetical protein MKX03_004354, partial [Papaver bracteatum]
NQMLATKDEASVGLKSVLLIPTDLCSEISTAGTKTNNQVRNEIPFEKVHLWCISCNSVARMSRGLARRHLGQAFFGCCCLETQNFP